MSEETEKKDVIEKIRIINYSHDFEGKDKLFEVVFGSLMQNLRAIKELDGVDFKRKCVVIKQDIAEDRFLKIKQEIDRYLRKYLRDLEKQLIVLIEKYQ